MNKRYQFTVIDMETKAVKWTAPFSNTERMLTETLDYCIRNPNWAVRITETANISEEILLPCPFCGNEMPELIEVTSAKDHWRVGCSKCGSYNNISNCKKNALAQWNSRAI